MSLARPLAIPALLALAIGLVSSAWGLSEQEVEERIHRISAQLRCPTCQAISVNDSEAAFSRQIRDKVRRMVEEGQSDDEIKAYFVSRYGEWILRAPKKEGLGLVLWIAPVAALLLAGSLIGYRLLRNTRPSGPATSADATPLTEAQRARIARDLERFEDEA